MNILHAVNAYFALPFFLGDQFKYFKNKGHNMFVVCSPSEYLANYSKEQGFEYLETPITRSIALKDDVKSIISICKYIRKNRVDIVVGHTPKGGLLSMIAGFVSRTPQRIYFRHGLVYETSHGLMRFILKTCDRVASMCATKIVCVSPSVLAKSIKDKLAPARKQMILGNGTCNGIDTESKFNPSRLNMNIILDLKRQYGINSDDFVIGYTGRLVKDKGIIPLVEAFDMLDASMNYKLLLVGMFEDRDALPLQIRNRILSDPRIIYTGFINGGIEYYYSIMNVYVLASYREGFPTGVLEAQAMEIPVLTTRVTGCCDSIINNKTGLFISHEPIDIMQKIKKISQNHVIDGKEGRTWVVENFNSHIIWKDIEKLFEGKAIDG